MTNDALVAAMSDRLPIKLIGGVNYDDGYMALFFVPESWQTSRMPKNPLLCADNVKEQQTKPYACFACGPYFVIGIRRDAETFENSELQCSPLANPPN